MKRLYIGGPTGLSMFKVLFSCLVLSSCSIFAEVLCCGITHAGELQIFGSQLKSKYESKPIEMSWRQSDEIQFYRTNSQSKSLTAEQSASYRSTGSDYDEGEVAAKDQLISRNDEALGGSLGVFHFGYYSIYDAESSSWRACNAWTLCGDKIFGFIGSLDYVKRIYRIGDLSFDLDLQAGLGYQSISKSWYRPMDESEGKNLFALASVVPMARYRLPHRLDNFSVGAGAGASMALGTIPYERPYNIPLMVAINAEIAYRLGDGKAQEVYLSLRHRCAAFGILNDIDDSQVGSQWYQIGFRKWF